LRTVRGGAVGVDEEDAPEVLMEMPGEVFHAGMDVLYAENDLLSLNPPAGRMYALLELLMPRKEAVDCKGATKHLAVEVKEDDLMEVFAGINSNADNPATVGRADYALEELVSNLDLARTGHDFIVASPALFSILFVPFM